MHTASGNICLGLGHKARKQTVAFCHCLYRQLKGHKIVCDAKRFLIFKVHLMLSGCHLMMGCLDLTAEILHRQDDITAGILA